MANGNKTGSDYKVGKNRPPIGTPFSSERQPEKNGRTKGSVNLSTRVRALLEDAEQLPPAIAETIRIAVGGDKQALECHHHRRPAAPGASGR